MPATADRDEIILRATSKVNAAMSQKPEEKDYQTEHSIKIAQSTISSLQVTWFLSFISFLQINYEVNHTLFAGNLYFIICILQ